MHILLINFLLWSDQIWDIGARDLWSLRDKRDFKGSPTSNYSSDTDSPPFSTYRGLSTSATPKNLERKVDTENTAEMDLILEEKPWEPYTGKNT